MLAKVHLGYRDGVRLPSVTYSPAVYGNVLSARVEGVQVLHLWPHDLPANAITPESVPLATLWRPEVSVVLHNEVGLRGLECRSTGGRPRWLLQRWFMQPMVLTDLLRELAAKMPRPGGVAGPSS